MELLSGREIYNKLKTLFSEAEDEIIAVSPWVGGISPYELINSAKPEVRIRILIRLSDVKDLNIDDCKIFSLSEEKRIQLYLSKNLHAKFYIFDNRKAVLGSANLTDKGLNRFEDGNLEVAIYTENKKIVEELKEKFHRAEKIDLFRDNFAGFLYKLEPPYLEILSPTGRFFPLVEISSHRVEGTFLQKLRK